MFAIFFVFVLVMFGTCGGRSPLSEPRQNNNGWPNKGMQYCHRIIHEPTKQSCTECIQNSGTDWIQASECVAEWLPARYAACSRKVNPSNNGIGDQRSFESCLKRADNKQKKENKRANVLYNAGGRYLTIVGDSKIVEDGGAAVFSCFAQELVLDTKSLQNELGESCGSCYNRFQMDDANLHWHLHPNDRPHRLTRSQDLPETSGEIAESQPTKEESSARMNRLKERTLVYEYGYVGNDMPFHGIGPFAVDILKGECIFKSLKNASSLNELVKAIFDSTNPVPAWIFRELLNHITSIDLPN